MLLMMMNVQAITLYVVTIDNDSEVNVDDARCER